MRSRYLIIAFILIALFFLYSVRSILTPFIFAILAAYILNPLVNFFQKKGHMPRTASIAVVFIVLTAIVVGIVYWVGGTLVHEAREIATTSGDLNNFGQNTIDQLPEFVIGDQHYGLKPLAQDLPKTLFSTANKWQNNLGPVVTNAAERVINILVFLISTVYLLKDGHKLVRFLRGQIPDSYKEKARELESEINQVMGNYLRGQILLVLIMATASWVFLSILGVKFALTLALLTGFLELIPLVGPFLATGLAALTAFLTIDNRWGLDPTTLATLIILVYITLRLIEDYFIIPQILGHVTKLHPLVVLFAVIAGGKLGGAVGFILAVPVAATIRISYIFLREEINWKK